MIPFKHLKANLKKDFSEFNEIKVAILADSASQLFCQALRGYGYTQQTNFKIWEAEYDQIQHTIVDKDSELYSFQPQFVIIYQSSQKLWNKFYSTDANKEEFSIRCIDFLRQISETLTQRTSCKVIIFNFPEINDGIFGNFANKVVSSFVYQLRKINFDLMNLSQELSNVFISDISAIQNLIGRNSLTDIRLQITAENDVEIDALGLIAKNCTDIVFSISGRFKKCLILDLDNTLWGGIIGDDGIDKIEIGDLGIGKAFTNFQKWIKQLKGRGIILAISSKNTEHIAKEPFEKHPDMILRLEDIAVFAANWNNKVDNIKYIQSILNIGYDSMVFLDDNPFEREMVKSGIPHITVPDLPEDPAEYLSYLYSLNLFETASFTEADTLRNDQYRQEASRAILLTTFENEDEFLESLHMTASVKAIDNFSLPRAAQLTQRSNQFNLRTIRYSQAQLNEIIKDSKKVTLAISLKDKFGDYGLISLIIAEILQDNELFIDTWIMSCRVLKRGVEKFVLNEIVSAAIANDCTKIIGEYIPTAKNDLVKNHYESMNFIKKRNIFLLDIKEINRERTYIN